MAEEITNASPQEQKPVGFGILGEFGEEALISQETTPTEEQNVESAPVADQTAAGSAPPVEPQPTTPEQEAPAPATEDWFRIEQINERFGTEFKTEEDIKNAISSLTENQDLIGRRDYYKELEETLQQVIEQANQMYGSKEGFAKKYIAEHLSNDKNAGVVSRIVNADIDNLSELEAMALRLQYISPTLASKPEQAVKGLLKEYGVDVDDPDFDPDNIEILDPQQLVRLAQHGAEARAYLKNLVSSVQVPEIKDFKAEIEAKVAEKQKALADQAAAKQKLAEQWSGKAKEIADRLKSIEFKRKDKDGNENVKFTYDVPQELVKSLVPYLADYAIQNGYDLTQENVAKVESELAQFVKEERMDEIMEAYANHVVAKNTEVLDNKVHNNKPISQTEAPSDHAKSYADQANEAFLKQLGVK